MSRPLVIGCGNPDRGDDAAGLLVARRLGELGVEAREHTGEVVALMELWSGADHVILVDALVSGAEPGSIRVLDAKELSEHREMFRFSTHALGVAGTVELARLLGRCPARLTVYGIEAAAWEPGAPPSQAVLAAVERAAAMIVRELAEGANYP